MRNYELKHIFSFNVCRVVFIRLTAPFPVHDTTLLVDFPNAWLTSTLGYSNSSSNVMSVNDQCTIGEQATGTLYKQLGEKRC